MAVSISGTSGSSAHGGPLVITGSGFGTKTKVAPVVWDNCSHGQVLRERWDGGWPDQGGNYVIDYRTPSAANGRTLTSAAHSRVTKYLCGANYPGNGYNNGYNVMAWKNVAVTWPMPIYMSWYYRLDPAWNTSGDDNHKWFDYSEGTSPFNTNWYIESAGGPASFNAHTNDNGSGLGWNTDLWYGSGFPRNPKTAWVKIEVELVLSNTSTGCIKVWADGVLVMNLVNDNTDSTLMGANGAVRAIAFGGYSRTYLQDHWRYFNDIYFDISRARVILGNASTLAACTVREVQIPTAWNNTNITVTVNRASFSDSASVYLYIYDSTGTANANGFLVSGSGVTSPPPAPTNLQIR